MRTAEQLVNAYTLSPRRSAWIKSALANLWIAQGHPGRAAELVQDSGIAIEQPLTQRELEVLQLIEAGNSNQSIAEKLVVSIPTVKRHISNIYAKLGVESRTQAVSVGRERKLLE